MAVNILIEDIGRAETAQAAKTLLDFGIGAARSNDYPMAKILLVCAVGFANEAEDGTTAQKAQQVLDEATSRELAKNMG